MKFSDVETFVNAGLTTKGYAPLPMLLPGPATNTDLQGTSPDAMVFLGLGGGPGLDTEHLFDGTFVHVRVIGTQNDYGYAEALAADVDAIFLALDRNGQIGTTGALFVTRTGGPPSLAEKDTADRYHFICDYVAEVQSGL